MWCSLFDVVDGKGKVGRGSLAALINKLEKDRLVSFFFLFFSKTPGFMAKNN